MSEKRKPMNQNNHIKIAISVALSLVILICAGIVIGRIAARQKAGEEYDKLKEAARTEEGAKTEQGMEEEEEEKEEIPYEGIPKINFETLWEENTDICGWINVPGTDIDYPVLRNESATEPHDAYYLNHTVDGRESLPGAIYMEPCNSGLFTDYNTVLYGHNMGNGTMFAGLHQYDDDAFFEENEYVYVVTPEKYLVYRIFAAVSYDDRHIMRKYDFTREAQRQEFLDSLKANRDMRDNFREGVEVTTESQILTLSTCIKGEDNKRLIVEAVLIDEYTN